MTLVTLQRLAPAAPNASTCHLCDASIGGSTQDDLLIGQPGTAEVRAVICTRCGDVVVRLVELCGSPMSVLVKGGEGPTPRGEDDSELDLTRHRLTREAETLGRSAQTLRGEAEKLTKLQEMAPISRKRAVKR
jgi:hypothetical protein